MTDHRLYCLHGTLLTFDCPDCQRERFSNLESKLAFAESANEELRKELSALKSATQSDRECVRQVIERLLSHAPPQTNDQGQILAFVEGRDAKCAEMIAAHTNPIRDQLEEAVGLLSYLIRLTDPRDCTRYAEIKNFLATIQSNEGVGNG